MGRHIIGRIVVFSVNFALWGSGILLIVFGSIGVSNQEAAVKMLAGVSSGVVDNVTNVINIVPYLQGVGIFMIVLGCFLFLLGGNGCHGIMRKSKKSTMMYFIWLLCAILVELALIIYAGVYPTTTQAPLERSLQRSLNSSFEKLTVSTNGSIFLSQNQTAQSWQLMEFESKCCGANGWQSYDGNFPPPSYQYTINNIPYNGRVSITCCTVRSGQPIPPTNASQFVNLDDCLDGRGPQGSYNTDGCGKAVNTMVYQFNLIAIIISSCLIAAEIVGVIFAARIWKDTD